MTLPGSIPSGRLVEQVIASDIEPAHAIEGRSTWQLAWARLSKDKAAVGSAVVIVLIILMAIFAPVFAAITGHGVNQQFRTTGLNGFGQPVGPNGTFALGTDDLG